MVLLHGPEYLPYLLPEVHGRRYKEAGKVVFPSVLWATSGARGRIDIHQD